MLWTVDHQAPLSMGFCRQEHWIGLSYSPLGDLPDPGIETRSPVSPPLLADSLTMSHWGYRQSPTGIKTIPMGKKCKKSKMAIWGGLTNSCELYLSTWKFSIYILKYT